MILYARAQPALGGWLDESVNYLSSGRTARRYPENRRILAGAGASRCAAVHRGQCSIERGLHTCYSWLADLCGTCCSPNHGITGGDSGTVHDVAVQGNPGIRGADSGDCDRWICDCHHRHTRCKACSCSKRITLASIAASPRRRTIKPPRGAHQSGPCPSPDVRPLAPA